MKKRALLKAKTLGDSVYLAIEKHLQKILKHEDDVLKDRDAEALHQMRVGMRRLRSAVTGFASVIDLPKEAREKKIAKVAHCLGELRDLDVLKEELKTRYKPLLPASEQKHLETVLEHLDKQRTHALRKIQSSKSAQQYEQLKQAFQKWLKQPNYTELAQLPIRDVLPDLLLPSVSQLFLHRGWLLGNSETSVVKSAKSVKTNSKQPRDPATVEQLLATQGSVLHSLRKQTKRVRYQMELFNHFYGEAYEESLNHLKNIQSILGQIQDNVVLGEFITEVLHSDIKTCMPELAKQLVQTNYQAWQDWQPLQQQYLNFETRQVFHEAVLHPSVELGEYSTR